VTASNYLSIVCAPECRRLHGQKRSYYYPFDADDMRSVTAASESANKWQAHLERHDVASILAVFLPCNMLDLPVIASEPEIEQAQQARMVECQRPVFKSYSKRQYRGTGGSPYGQQTGRRIGEGAA